MNTFAHLAGIGLLAAVGGAVVVAGMAARAAPGGADRADAVMADTPPPLASAKVVADDGQRMTAYEGVVEALRQTAVAAQMPGAVVALHVKAGDRVQAGQVLVRIDARAAEQGAVAGAAQARAARAAMDEATRDVERQQQLFARGFISGAALDRAQAHFKTAQAEASAQLASAEAARTQSDLHVVRAPYAGVVAKVGVVVGDMAMPGRALLTLYDPGALRVTAAIPQSAVARLEAAGAAHAEVPGAQPGLLKPVRAQWLPTVDAASHTLELRLDLPADTNAAPGMFARAWLPHVDSHQPVQGPRLFVPAQAVVRRSELSAVYVIDAGGRATLRQVRPGRSEAGQVEILSGVAAGERVALDPQAATRVR